MPAALFAALVVTGLTMLVPGVAIALRPGSRVSGVLLAIAGALTIASAPAEPQWGEYTSSWLLIVAEGVLGASAMAYPRLPWHDLPSWLAFAVMVVAPLWISSTAAQPWHSSGTGVIAMIAVPPLVQMWWRVETASRDDRRTLLWFLLPALVGLLVGGAVGFMWGSGANVLAGVIAVLAFATVGPGAWVGVARPSAVDVRGLVATTAVYAVALVAVFTLFLTLVSALDSVGVDDLNARANAVIGAVCALAFEPARRYLRLVADEILFGIRPDPFDAANRVAATAGDDPRSALDAIRAALVLPYVALRSDDGTVISSGSTPEFVHRVGEFEVGLRAGDLALPEADVKVLTLAGPLLAQSMRLQAARELAANAREEERRRLRRDLHDGLGPRLSGIAFTADAARLSADDPSAMNDHLRRVRAESVAAIKEIRELVYGMRPPALDEVGLVEAIRLQAGSMTAADGRPMQIRVDAADLPKLGAAVEVAVYRIVVEALANAARHSGSAIASACVSCADGVLRIVVEDEGVSDGSWVAGVGISSMRERAAEIGGTLIARGGREGGRVEATLPL